MDEDQSPHLNPTEIPMPPNPTSTMAASTSVVVDQSHNLRPVGALCLPQDRNLYRESERRKTFSNWRVPFLTPDSLAKAGFYYLKQNDLVRCPFCGVEINQWEENDNPWDDHKKWSPHCRFINNVPGNGNIPREAEPNQSSFHSEESGYDTCGMFNNTEFLNRLEGTLSVPKSKKPSFPEYSIQENRLTSFQMWPVSLKIKPSQLSEAGFFYTGRGDQTICFFCGGGLKDWEENDDPWVEHAKWFSKCAYVLLSKGKQFVENVQSNINIKDSRGAGVSPDTSTAKSQSENDVSSLKSCEASGEGKKNSSSKKEEDQMLCKICYTNEMAIVFVPCGHLMACVDCAMNLTHCGVCRRKIESQFRTFIS